MFLTRTLDPGGAERQLTILSKSFYRSEHQVTILVCYANGPLQKELEDAGVSVISLNKRGRWDILVFLFRLFAVLRKVKPSILHGYLVFPNILTALAKPFFPSMRMVWGVRASNVHLRHYDWLTRLSSWAECRLSRFADLVIVNSHAGREHAATRGFPSPKMIVIPNGIDTERFQPDRIAGQTIRKEWGISDHEKLIGLVARLDPMKDHLTFIQAAAELSKLRDDVRFVCVGTGPSRYQQKLQAMSKQLDVHSRLIWDGPRLDMPAVYNAFDLACSSSSWGEGFANAIGEAMASGVPCVATDVGDSAVIVGDIGVIVPPQDPKSLALAWSDMLCKEDMITGTYATQARAHIVRQFGHERLFQRTAQVLEQLLT